MSTLPGTSTPDQTLVPADHPGVQPPKVGVLMVNLGTPSSLAVKDIRRYLREFLSDARVIDYNPFLWKLVLNGVILNVRPRKTREAYKAVWMTETDESPLRFYTRRQAELTAERFRANSHLIIDWAMTYGEPSIAERVENLVEQGCHRIVVLPLYPQYSATTTASVCDRLFKTLGRMRWQPAIRTLDTWHDDPAYIDASAIHLQQHLAELEFEPEVLLLSFHGLPQRYLTLGDPYHCFCQKSGRLMTEQLRRSGLDIEVKVTFQSRFGPQEWLQPYTDKTLTALAEEGTRRVAVFSPGFVSDCIETTEELGIQAKDAFVAAGGEDFGLIPCLNDSVEGINMLENLIRRELSGWI